MISDFVVSLETAKQLKEKGFPQQTGFYYLERPRGSLIPSDSIDSYLEVDYSQPDDVFAAPISDELLQQLPKEVTYRRAETFLSICWGACEEDMWGVGYLRQDASRKLIINEKYRESSKSLADALGMLWLRLKDEGLLDND